MNRGVWVSALAACLGVWVTNLGAQQTTWRPVLRPAATAPSPKPQQGKPQPVPAPKAAVVQVGAELGRPVPVLRAAGADDWPDRSERIVQPPAYRPPLHEDPATRVPQPNEVIASSTPSPSAIQAVAGGAPAAVLEQDPAGGEQFATERPAPYSVRPAGMGLPIATPPAGVGPSLPPPGVLDASTAGKPEGVTRNWTQQYSATAPAQPPPLPGDDPPPTPPRWYLSGEYLLWWAKQDKTPPLVTTSSPGDAGFIDRPSTQVLFGGNLDRNPFSGGRFTGGYWIDDDHTAAVEVTGFFLGQQSARGNFNSSDFPVLARPFQIVNTGTEFSELVGFPGSFTGKVNVNAPSDLWGIESNLRCPLCSCHSPTQIFGGFRYLNLNENITITEEVVGSATAPAPLTNVSGVVFDSFQTRNQFYGGQLGAERRWQYGHLDLDVVGKVALGVTNQEITIDGGQRLTNLTTSTTSSFQGGLLALPGANIGHFTKDVFSVVPEVGVTLGYQVLPCLRASFGYNFLYWSGVVRPGEQIDRQLDVTRIPNFNPPAGVTPAGGVHPSVPFKESDYWVQGLTFGLEFTW